MDAPFEIVSLNKALYLKIIVYSLVVNLNFHEYVNYTLTPPLGAG